MSNVIEWINQTIILNGNDKIDSEDFDHVRDFSLLWNLFEDIFCDRFCDINKLFFLLRDEERINKLKKEELSLKIENIFTYFMDRYSDNNKLEKLNFKSSENENIIKNLIKNQQNEELHFNQKIEIILSIIYRYRNNLFHGEKDMRFIKYQNENFEKANEFLMLFIEYFE